MNNIENIKFFLGDLKASNYNLSFIKDVENLIQENKDLKNQLNDIHSNFCKFNWKESNNIQVYNQLKELYESIYRKDK